MARYTGPGCQLCGREGQTLFLKGQKCYTEKGPVERPASRPGNVSFRRGFAVSRSGARQLVRHRHVEVNGRIVDVPSYEVAPGDEIAVQPRAKEVFSIQESL